MLNVKFTLFSVFRKKTACNRKTDSWRFLKSRFCRVKKNNFVSWHIFKDGE